MKHPKIIFYEVELVNDNKKHKQIFQLDRYPVKIDYHEIILVGDYFYRVEEIYHILEKNEIRIRVSYVGAGS